MAKRKQQQPATERTTADALRALRATSPFRKKREEGPRGNPNFGRGYGKGKQAGEKEREGE